VLARFAHGAQVLVVDDDPDVRTLLRRMLEAAGYRALEAENGRAALTRIAETTPDLILLDLMMPEMDGFEFLDELRRGGPRGIPIVVVTAKDLTADDHRRLNGSVERILQKAALDREALLVEVRELVAKGVKRRKAAV